MQKKSLRSLAAGGVIAAAYAALSLVLAPLTFGAEFRVSEALTLLPVVSPASIWGVSLGCLITNVVGVGTGANFLGALDILFGTAATVAAAFATRALRRFRFKGLPVLSALPPILINAAVIGAEWCWAATGSISGAFWFFAGQIALGQLPPCLLGIFLVRALERRGLQNKIEG